jgi:hypothetical protein
MATTRYTFVHALPITAFVLALFYKWFALDDRYAVFLYNHSLAGPAGPFDDITTSRYWMAGLVASGAVMVLYIATNWLLGRIQRDYRAPAWWHVWLLCALPVVIGIPLITMTQNSPTMPLVLAAACVVATLTGLAFALMPGALAAHRPRDLVWIAVDGLGLVPPLLLLRALELPGMGLKVSMTIAIAGAIGGIALGAMWLGGMSILRAWQRKPSPGAVDIFVAGLCWSYLALPLGHYLIATPAQFKYITTASNFFAWNVPLRLATFVIAVALAIGAAQIRKRLIKLTN